MIVQRRAEGLRLFRQHDHALASGELALGWQAAGSVPRVSNVLVTAVAHHDDAWCRTDRSPVWNPASGMPHDFLDVSVESKFADARWAISRLERVHPYAAYLVSLHYGGFAGAPESFRSAEARRRRSLEIEMGARLPSADRIDDDVTLLRLFDVLTLHACLTDPAAVDTGRPSWLTGRYALPDGGAVGVQWTGPDALACDPGLFGDTPLRLELPYRDLAATRFESKESLRAAWDAAPERIWTPVVTGA